MVLSSYLLFPITNDNLRNVGESMSTEEYEQGWAEQQVFREWFNENVMSSNPESQSTAIMVMPFGSADPDYRDVPHL